MTSSLRSFRPTRVELTSNFFTCKACAGPTRPRDTLLRLLYGLQSHSVRRLAGRTENRKTVPLLTRVSSPSKTLQRKGTVFSPLESLGRRIAIRAIDAGSVSGSAALNGASTKARATFFPETTSRVVGYWLLGSAASVFGIVVFGGLTRLTESGLSITDWRPVTGSLPPMNPADWEHEFAKYRSSPEFALLNPNMTLTEFKKIYWMEWTHRLWGRVVGLTFVIPSIYFIARRRVSARTSAALLGISSLIGFQGFLGWWMVKSGLRDDLFAPGAHPRVSQYRLAAHLGTAFACYSAMLLTGLSVLRENRWLRNPAATLEFITNKLRNPNIRPFRRSVTTLALLVFTTVLSGALVAGLDAGLIYNEFPYMGNGLTPPKSELFDSFYSRSPDRSDLYWRNALENPSLVQLDHRILATTTFTSVMALWAYARFSPSVRNVLTRSASRGVTAVVSLAWMQVILGISTLLYLVPTPLAATHQAGSLALLTSVLVLRSRLAAPAPLIRLLQKRLSASRATTTTPAVAAAVPKSMGMGKTHF